MVPDDAMERSAVKTYVPKYQKEKWKEDANRLDMSQSEFVRAMVQAGRRGFDLGQSEQSSPDSNPRGNGLEEQVLNSLRDGVHTWDELLSKISEQIEDQLDETLQELQQQNRIQYSGRHGGYELIDDD